ncbi:MAG: pilin [Patescibacteria group bacterium]
MFSQLLAVLQNKRVFILAVCILLVSSFVVADFSFAGTAQEKAKAGLELSGAGFKDAGSSDITKIIGALIGALIGILGVYFLISLVRGGFLWMTAGGETEDVAKAKKIMTNAAVGLMICLAAYSISDFVLTNVVNLVKKS